jgi:reverse gyrase
MALDASSELEFVTLPPSVDAALAVLAPPVRAWFTRHIGSPTAAQCLSWPVLAEGKHLLLSAPTGSGKTLAAFLPLLSQLLNEPPAQGLRGLYVSPLKALCNDAYRTLRLALRGIRQYLPESSRRIRVALRTGDAAADERRRLLTDPPDILLTTPESLAVLLSQPAFTELIAPMRAIIVDEVHAFAESKRGADLSLSLERLHLHAADRRCPFPRRRVATLHYRARPRHGAASRERRIARSGRRVLQPLAGSAKAGTIGPSQHAHFCEYAPDGRTTGVRPAPPLSGVG